MTFFRERFRKTEIPEDNRQVSVFRLLRDKNLILNIAGAIKVPSVRYSSRNRVLSEMLSSRERSVSTNSFCTVMNGVLRFKRDIFRGGVGLIF